MIYHHELTSLLFRYTTFAVQASGAIKSSCKEGHACFQCHSSVPLWLSRRSPWICCLSGVMSWTKLQTIRPSRDQPQCFTSPCDWELEEAQPPRWQIPTSAGGGEQRVKSENDHSRAVRSPATSSFPDRRSCLAYLPRAGQSRPHSYFNAAKRLD